MLSTRFNRLNRFLLVLALAVGAATLLPAPASAQTYPHSALKALSWRLVGPFRGGRSDAVAGVPGKPRTYYFGSADGGVWKTTDGGNSWQNVSDCCFKGGAVGAIAVAPSDPNVIYAGMGESFPRGNMATGDGVWKSTDAGKTWTHVGLADTRVIGDIVVDPATPSTSTSRHWATCSAPTRNAASTSPPTAARPGKRFSTSTGTPAP